MGDTVEPNLCASDLLKGDPRWMMYPGKEYAYVSLPESYTGVVDRNGCKFAIETDGLVIVRLWPVIGSDAKLRLDTCNPLPCQNEVLKPSRSPSKLKKIDWNIVTKWAGSKANERNPFKLAMYEAGEVLQAAVIHCGYTDAMVTPKLKYKGPEKAQKQIVSAFKLLGAAVAASAVAKPPNGGIEAVAEMLLRIASGKNVVPNKPSASVRGLVSSVLHLARSRRRTFTVKTLHEALKDARTNFPAARPLMVTFNPSLEFMIEPEVPEYKNLAKAFADLKKKDPAIASYVRDGKASEPF